ncbi:site-specific DNA-methyltransferase [Stenotrophomonas maltophilia]|uniref:site-specific DNA-methyltransferase n=1 Tax=Stenotrophomonas TaxID=40323 RepID=UPI000C154FD2|nr:MULTISPECIES: site-specific DNA-methyltransferase [Stenotrophomonas]MBH1578208.1 site-specific DNA-methyltransferase [Stenotrophomonas maltophilia]MBH1598392.1 site-specific DNA-methyltransferase [Stenotrophomonas maltophilia]MBH1604595.1 site-specific DNA-methyltransferase [Stenotrophomonas maltophilia]MBH1760923.1 site-specific DNA-methyltransferase [Stenotrophomonas maltophilia]MBH1763363.1 site-specific DNA-methyltransferase [Stenotrophomonas maltophilia]
MKYEELSRAALIKLLQEHDAERAEAGRDGIVLNYSGRTAPWQIVRQVKPRMFDFNKRASVGSAEEECVNELWDGENLATMVTLYKYRGQVDLVLTDPPYNTGEDFRYNDKWDKDPNDPDMGDLVAKDDGSRHSKWLRFMTPRLWMMREMLKPGGVIAICIDHRELYRLGMLMDEIFHEENRIGIINWQKSYSPKSDVGGKKGGLSTATEYVLVYAKDIERAKTGLLDRTEKMNSRYRNDDGDPEGDWTAADATAPEYRTTGTYAIQSPFTGKLYYPTRGHWVFERAEMKRLLQGWGSQYVSHKLDDECEASALVIKGCAFANGEPVSDQVCLERAREKAFAIRNGSVWPGLVFTDGGEGGPRAKKHLAKVKKGKVPLTYWANEDYEGLLDLGVQSWDHAESGHSQAGINELDSIVGKGHGFRTVKPLRLMKKIIQIWCKPDGIVLDPFAGSGTTANAVLELNKESDANRRFILVEQGNDEKGDHYAKTLTADRIRRVITGKWKSGDREPLGGGFRYFTLKREKVDANGVNALAREEMMDLLLVSYWDRNDKAKSYLRRLPVGGHKHLFAVNSRNEGFFLVWSAPDQPSILTRTVFKEIVQEAKAVGLAGRYHVYAALAPYTGSDIEFYQIPDKVLEHIGFNARADAYNNDGGMDAD